MATHSSILAWRISWTEEPGRLHSTGSQRVRYDWATLLSLWYTVWGNLPISFSATLFKEPLHCPPSWLLPFTSSTAVEEGSLVPHPSTTYCLGRFWQWPLNSVNTVDLLKLASWNWTPLWNLLEKAMATHSSTLAGKSHEQRNLEGCSPWGR